MSNNLAYIFQGDTIVIQIEGRSYTLAKNSHLNYEEVYQALVDGEYDKVVELVDVGRAIAEFYNGEIVIRNGGLFYRDEQIANTLTDRIIEMYRQKKPLAPMLAFFKNLMENPSHTAVNELYMFLEDNNHPITVDGHFMAYKRVRKLTENTENHKAGDLVDVYTGKVLNNVGTRVRMDRRNVVDDRRKCCEKGLHFASLAYLEDSGYGAGPDSVLLLIKVNPRDVVSVPEYYKNSKGRCCQYEVVSIIEEENANEAFNSPVYTTQTVDVKDEVVEE